MSTSTKITILGLTPETDALWAELTEAAYAILLGRIEANNKGRRGLAGRYLVPLGAVDGVVLPAEKDCATNVDHQYTVCIEHGRRAEVQQTVETAGVEAMFYYHVPVHQLQVYWDSGYSLPMAKQRAVEMLRLPIWPQLGQGNSCGSFE